MVCANVALCFMFHVAASCGESSFYQGQRALGTARMSLLFRRVASGGGRDILSRFIISPYGNKHRQDTMTVGYIQLLCGLFQGFCNSYDTISRRRQDPAIAHLHPSPLNYLKVSYTAGEKPLHYLASCVARGVLLDTALKSTVTARASASSVIHLLLSPERGKWIVLTPLYLFSHSKTDLKVVGINVSLLLYFFCAAKEIWF